MLLCRGIERSLVPDGSVAPPSRRCSTGVSPMRLLKEFRSSCLTSIRSRQRNFLLVLLTITTAAGSGPNSLLAQAPEVKPSSHIAIVNGQTTISRELFVNELIEMHGLRLLEDLVLMAAVMQRARELDLSVTSLDVEAAEDRALRSIAGIDDTDRPFDRAAAEELLNDFLEAKNLTATQWDRRMKQRAYLYRIAQHEVKQMQITDQMLKEQYHLSYGEKIQIRHIQLPSLAAVRGARALLRTGQDFELVAMKLSENRITGSRGGLMPEFSRKDPAVPPLIREAAFKLKPDEVSQAIATENWYHLLKLEKRTPEKGMGYAMADRKDLEEKLTERLTRQRMESLEAELFQSAAVEIRQDELKRQFDRRYLERGEQ